ncbi:MAG: VCBS repeat-containing protein [Acidobacteria bacterium]|nr:VCBS repeat-containing protein [Acidobacteriota bacterium]
MAITRKGIKYLCLGLFVAVATAVFFGGDRLAPAARASGAGPVPGVTGAPGEVNCTNCHIQNSGPGQFTITAPASYAPGQTYQITVRHQTSDSSRRRWGFQLTALAGTTPAAVFGNLTAATQIVDGAAGRKYIEHTTAGSFAGQAGGALWTFNWTAPATNLGPVTLYAAGNEANNDGTADGDQIYLTSVTIQPPAVAPTVRSPFDFDGDSKTDISIFRPAPAEWWYSRSSDGGNRAAQFGQTTDRLVPGDFTGDGKADFAFWRPSTGFWFVLRSEDGSFFSFPFGTTGDVPVPADYDGDGKTDPAVFRPSTLTWFISLTGGGTTIATFGAPGDAPVPADYDGDGKADIAIYRTALGEWWIQRSTAGLLAFQFGSPTDRPVPGDYTGDGKADAAFFRPSTGEWFVLRSENFSFFSAPFGTNGDVPVPGDYDGDGKFDFGVFRPSVSTWFVNRSAQGVLIASFGQTGDVPVPSAYVP